MEKIPGRLSQQQLVCDEEKLSKELFPATAFSLRRADQGGHGVSEGSERFEDGRLPSRTLVLLSSKDSKPCGVGLEAKVVLTRGVSCEGVPGENLKLSVHLACAPHHSGSREDPINTLDAFAGRLDFLHKRPGLAFLRKLPHSIAGKFITLPHVVVRAVGHP
ncbi:hypothetical protein FQN60_010020 [Etheostoma spectabile]|uniref:Uncharacterized protein n=1 Tax=Etheostoma spectabile TaxID=54343 RepID=A0A5J5D7X5_9PERO|nr:hypothetical protein FQN60_010020 [Etheostoma spectabile]